MTSSWIVSAAWIVLGAAVLVTVALTAGAQVENVTLALVASVAGNFAIPALWAAASMADRRMAVPAGVAGATVLVLMALLGWREGLVAGCHVTAGLVGGWTIAWGWRVLPILLVSALALVPAVFLELEGTSIMAASEQLSAENRKVFAETLPEGLSESERAAALADFDEMARSVLALQQRLWPAVLLMGLMIQAGLALIGGWLVVRAVHGRAPRPEVRPWENWRAPFVSVWMLIGGLVAVVTQVDGLMTVGWSTALLAAMMLGVQGLALQAWFARRLLSPLGRTLYWVLGALFFAPLMLGGGVVIGLADQWRDLRQASRLDQPADNDDS